MTLWVEQAGQGPDLVLLHGWGLSSEIWQPLREQLESRFRLTLIDLPGLGRSPVLPDADIDALADALLAQAPARAVWLGWSLGGLIATAAALRAPERVSALVTLASNPCFVAREDWPSAMPQATFTAFSDGLAVSPAKTLQRFASLQVQGSASARAELKQLRAVLAQSPADGAGLAQTLALLQLDRRSQLATVLQPSLHILGSEDGLVPEALVDELKQLQPSARLELFEASAHLPFLSDPERFVSVLDAFVADVADREAHGRDAG